jgi:cytochrome c553/DNA-binding NarL/FixJ family response regulator
VSVPRLALATCAALLVAAGTQGAQGSPTAAQLAAGQRMYREGIGAYGAPLAARAPANARLTGKDVACAACHRRSGYGTTEGQFAIRPITGPALLQEQTVAVHNPRVRARLGVRLRPPYTEALLARAIRKGVDASGTPLSPAMPRYALSDEEMQALTAYLFSLSAQAAPGVDEQDIHLATVIQPGVAPERRRAMLEVMQAFVKDKDANMRLEERRREAGNFRRYRAYRKWVLHVWELNGPSETWGAQLEAYYSKQPVFALIGGLGASSWRPIHEFSERLDIPCVFPQADLPVHEGPNYYTFYFSKGVVLEAQVLAKFLRDRGTQGKILQVYRRAEVSSAAAAALRAALKADARLALEDRVLEGRASAAFWRPIAAQKPDALVLWLGREDLPGAQELGGSAGPAVYLSFDLLDAKDLDPAIAAGANMRLIYPSDLPPRRETRLLRNKMWLHSKGIALMEETVQMNTLFAMAVVSDALGHLRDSFSRDFFVERIEHAVNQALNPSVFMQVSLGPEQRYAAKGSAIVQQVDAGNGKWKALSGWIVP